MRNGRLTSEGMLAAAERVFESRMAEFEKLDLRREGLELEFPWLIGEETAPEDCPKGILPSYEMIVTRLDSMSKELQQAAGIRQRAVREQVNTLREAGELLPVNSVVGFLQEMMVHGKTHCIPVQAHLYQQKVKETMEEFLRQNPAGVLVAAGTGRNEGGEISHSKELL